MRIRHKHRPETILEVERIEGSGWVGHGFTNDIRKWYPMTDFELLPSPRWVDCTGECTVKPKHGIVLANGHSVADLSGYGEYMGYRLVKERLWRINFEAVDAFRIERQED